MTHLPFPVIEYRPEFYVSSSDDEYLADIEELLAGHDVDPAKIVYSGFGGHFVRDGSLDIPRPPAIYVMNSLGWRDIDHTSAAQYAEQYADTDEIPVIGVYHTDQLLHAAGIFEDEEEEDLLENIAQIVVGLPLSDTNGGIYDLVVHREYPEKSPADALAAMILPPLLR